MNSLERRRCPGYLAIRLGSRLISERRTRLAALDVSIMRGVGSADAGRVYELEDIAAMLDTKYAKMAHD
jgi:antitoxin ParD1/3/4